MSPPAAPAAARAPRPSATRYAAIEAALRGDIESGAQPLGSCLPTEHALARRFRASRFTVRQALGELRRAGMIEPRPGVGTFVIADRPRAGFVQTLKSFEELLQYPANTWREEVDVRAVEVDEARATMLDCAPGAPWVRVLAMRRIRGSELAISWLEAYLSPQFADVATRPNPEGDALLKQIEAVHGHRAANARVEIFARSLPDALAEPMRAEAGSPALVIRRRYRGPDGGLYLVTESTHPESRFALNFEFARQ